MKIAVIGLGRFGHSLALALRSKPGVYLLAVDRDRDVIDRLEDAEEWAFRLDGTDPAHLAEYGIDSSLDLAVISIGEEAEEVQRWILTLSGLRIPRILARAQTDAMASVMTRLLGVVAEGLEFEVIRPEREAARQLAGRLLLPGIREIQQLRDSDHSVATVRVPRRFHEQSVQESGLRRDFGLNVLRLRRWPEGDGGREAEEVIPVGPETELHEGDEITILGLPDRIRAFCEGE
jgi:trk system potassium uptake protein TrkA